MCDLVNSSIEILSQHQILAMETAGMRSFASVDELSEEGLRTVKSTTIDEARLLIKEVLVGLVKQHVETDAHRVKVKEMEAELKKKDALLKAFLSKGASISDISPPVMSDIRVPIDTREELFRVMQAPSTTSATAPPFAYSPLHIVLSIHFLSLVEYRLLQHQQQLYANIIFFVMPLILL
jgi:hypothetical protein